MGRLQEWWAHKIPILLTVAWGTYQVMGIPFVKYPSSLLLPFIALILGGFYAYLVNDLGDIEEDQLRGKKNAFSPRPKHYGLIVLGVIVGLGGLICVYGNFSPRALVIYVLNWLFFALYSLKPFRIKERGFWGIVFGALGDSLLPTLFLMASTADRFGRELPISWLLVSASWSLLLGLKLMIGHQLQDASSDQMAGTQTFVVTEKAGLPLKLVHRVLLPLELFFLILMTLMLPGKWIVCFFMVYLFNDWVRVAVLGRSMHAIMPGPNHVIFLQAFYEFFFPLALLLAWLETDLNYAYVIICFLLLFSLHAKQMARLVIVAIRKRRMIYRAIKNFFYS